MYPEIVMKHFMHPQNVGKIEDPSSIGEYVSASGGKAVFYALVRDGVVQDIKYLVSGCPFAIAVCSLISVFSKGKRVEELKIVQKDFLKQYFDYTSEQDECISLAFNAFLNCIEKV